MVTFVCMRISSVFTSTDYLNYIGQFGTVINEIASQLQLVAFSYCVWFKQSQILKFLSYAENYPVKKVYQKVADA